MEIHVHLKNAFPGGIANRRILFCYYLWFAFHPSQRSGDFSEKRVFWGEKVQDPEQSTYLEMMIRMPHSKARYSTWHLLNNFSNPETFRTSPRGRDVWAISCNLTRLEPPFPDCLLSSVVTEWVTSRGGQAASPEPPRATRSQPEPDCPKYPVPVLKYCITFVFLTLKNTQCSILIKFSIWFFPNFCLQQKIESQNIKPSFYVGVRWGDGSKTTSGTNSISTGTKIVPVGPLVPRKIFLSSKMMNSQPQHIQKREIVDMQIMKLKYKSKKKPWAIQFNRNMPQYKSICYSWSELITDNKKISRWSRDLLDVQLQFKYHSSFFLGLSANIPSVRS